MKENKFGNYFNECRKKAGLSLQDIADFLHLSKPYIWGIEKGNNKPPQKYEVLEELIKLLKLSNEETEKFFDLAVDNDKDIPADIKNLLMKDEFLIKSIRQKYLLEGEINDDNN